MHKSYRIKAVTRLSTSFLFAALVVSLCSTAIVKAQEDISPSGIYGDTDFAKEAKEKVAEDAIKYQQEVEQQQGAQQTVLPPTNDELLSYIKGRIPAFDSSKYWDSRADLVNISRQELRKEGYSPSQINDFIAGRQQIPASGGGPGHGTGGGPGEGGGEEASKSNGFVPLAPIPGVTDEDTAKDTSAFFSGAFKLGITIAGFLAVIMIAVGGLQYMSTDTIGGKGEGRERITYAIMGLLLILFAWILLSTINPDIVSLRLFN